MSEKLDPDLKPPATIEQEILPEIEIKIHVKHTNKATVSTC